MIRFEIQCVAWFPRRPSVRALLVAWFIITAGLLQVAHAESDPPAGWKLAWSDTFDRDELGDAWKVVDGQWELKDGTLIGQGTLLSARGFPRKQRHRTLPGESPPGFHRLEMDIQWKDESKPAEQDAPAICALIHTAPYNEKQNPSQNGYAFQIIRPSPEKLTILRNGQQLSSREASENPLQANQTHRIVVENDEGQLRLSIDGKTLLEHAETESLMGDQHDHIGLSFSTPIKILGVRLYIKQLDDGFF